MVCQPVGPSQSPFVIGLDQAPVLIQFWIRQPHLIEWRSLGLASPSPPLVQGFRHGTRRFNAVQSHDDVVASMIVPAVTVA